MEEIGERPQQHRLVNFRILYMVLQLIGITIVILMASWVFFFLDGVDLSTPHLVFNWHPLLMTIGMIYLYGNSILLYRGVRYARKKNLKISHATLFGIVMGFIVFALVAVFYSHNYAVPKPIPNMYSLHSWVGMGAVILFGCQWLGGFFSFLYPELRGPQKSAYMPYHIYFGLLGYVMAVGAALLGLSEKAAFHMTNIADLPNEGVIVNCIGGLLVIFAALICYLATNIDYKRTALPEDQILLTGNED